MHQLLRAAALVAASLTHIVGTAGEVVVHPQLQLDPEDIRDVYLGEKQFAGRVKLVPVDNAAIHDIFLAKVLQTDASKYAARWTRKSFREGLTPPPLKGSDAEVAAFVRATPGAIGYINGTAGAGVKVIFRF